MSFDLKIIGHSIHNALWNKDITISTAESCTAGRISSIITATPGSSKYYKGGIITYNDELKTKFLNIDSNLLHDNPSSEEIIKQMIIGANKLFSTNIAIAVHGYAGPGGDYNGTCLNGPTIGTIWIGVGNVNKIITKRVDGENGRERNLNIAVHETLNLLIKYLEEL